MKISLIIPTYKPKDYLWQCLDSVRNQTFSKKDFELILVLNGCNEPYYTQIKAYIEANLNDLEVNFIQTDQGGVSNARNIALDSMKGEYVTFIDDDDYISPSYLTQLYMQATPQIVSLCYPLAFQDGNSVNYPYRITKQYEKFAHRGIIPFYKACKFFDGPVYKLIHRDIIGDRRFNQAFKNGEDSLFMFLISDRMKEVRFTDKSAIYYRRFRVGSATTANRDRKTIVMNLLRMMKEYSRIYWMGMKRYNLSFYITRMLGALRSMIE